MTLATVRAALVSVPPLDWVLRLTLLLMFLRTPGDWLIRPAVLLLAGAGLVVPSLARKPPLWGGLALLAAAAVISDWPLADNHSYLLAYWCLAVCIALATTDPAGALAPNARLLIGLPFALAVLWKLGLSRDYLDGTFFRVTLLDDPRFEVLTRVLAGIGPELLEESREVLRQHVDGSVATLPAPALPERFHGVALTLTWWGIAIEGLVALAFLWPARVARASRDALLLAFCISTYAVASVAGFGWLLTIMGLAQCSPDRRGVRAAYVGAFVLILLYAEIPWNVLPL
jgi:hypothetical protein